MRREHRPPAPTRAERHGLVLLVLATLLYQVAMFEPFEVPNNDWYSFEDAARHLAAGELPLHSKRLPLFPGLVALLSGVVGGEHPELRAALLLNACFSLATLVLLFVLASRAIGRGAILVPVLYAATVQFHAAGLQPLVEPSLSFCVVLAFTLFRFDSPWQYAAAAAAALGRYEAVALLPILALASGRRQGRWPLQVGLAAAGLLPLLAWRVLAGAASSGGGTYLDLMRGMGFAPAPGFVWLALGESFPILHAPGVFGWLGAVLVLAPLGFGLLLGLRRRKPETLPLIAYFAAVVGVVVIFGVPKPRYVLPIAWIPIVFWAAGGMRWREVATRKIPADATDNGRVWAGAAAVVAMLGAGLVAMASRPQLAPAGVEVAYAVALVAAATPVALSSAMPHRATGSVLLAVAALLITTGTARKQTALWNIHHANHGSVALAGWLGANLGEDEGVVVLNPGAVHHLTGLPPERLTSFAEARVETPETLAAFMRDRGFRYAAWTHRPASDSPSAAYYDARKNVDLARAFASGEAVPGFAHVAQLPAPAGVEAGDSHVYRLVGSGP